MKRNKIHDAFGLIFLCFFFQGKLTPALKAVQPPSQSSGKRKGQAIPGKKKKERRFCSSFFFFLTAVEIKLQSFNGKMLYFSGKKEKMGERREGKKS